MTPMRTRSSEYVAQALRRHHERAQARETTLEPRCVYCGRRARAGTYPPTCSYCSDLPSYEPL